ncbi:phage portal protein [Parvularcula marina]|uniref:phage portal protein n=1 Tax=Parvularcula marina TaxID=2292771 RepID=UPI0035152EE7
MFGFKTKPRQMAREEKGSVLGDLIALHGGMGASWSSRSNVSLARTGYAKNPVVYRCVQMIAEAASSVPLFAQQGRERLEAHPLTALLRKPNPDQPGQSFLEHLYGHLQISGNAYAEVIEGLSVPAALYLLRPDQVTAETGPDGWPRAYLHKVGGKTRRLPRDTDGQPGLIHIRLFNPLDGREGQSPLCVAGNAIDLHNAATSWNKSLLDNAARPSGALIYRGPEGASSLTGEQFDRLKSELADTYQGQRQAGRPMVLDGGLDWKSMSLSPAEMDFRELKNGAAREIALAFGVPPMLLGIPGDNTYSNYAQAHLAFWRHTILPLITKVADSFSLALAGEGVSIGFDTDAIDALQQGRIERLRLLLDADVITDTEKRILLGFSVDAEVS